jgi:hypothetical protein
VVDIYINEKFLISTVADKFREGLNERFGFNCAIEQELPSDVTLSLGDKLSIRPRGELSDLKGSPIIIKSEHLFPVNGRLGGLLDGRIIGWSLNLLDKRPTKVQLYINGENFISVVANQYRDDLQRRFGVSCGFSVELPTNINLKKGDVVRARVLGDSHDLENSPLVIGQFRKSKS